ncbi:MAG: flagellar type III secretion system pore protein FliP [Lachnospiraceae bacterium]|nr:flagellar type III secretion system pore protein FliP [Lachnospiraceae bacterium]MDE7239101.1 flagellar type III secretion system pore protein FliP [Lachnospiraceae bacterium]
MKNKKRIFRYLCLLFTVGILFIGNGLTAQAIGSGLGIEDTPLTGETENSTTATQPGTAESGEDLEDLNIANGFNLTFTTDNGSIAGTLRILLTLTAIAVAPMLIICLTSFTRILIVMHFTRTALNTQTAPPNQVLIGLTLFLTFFIMSPTINTVYNDAYKPYEAGEIEQGEAIDIAVDAVREFMYPQTQRKDIRMFMEIANLSWTSEMENKDIPTYVLIPSFLVSELRTAFIIGFLIYIPFLVIDMVVASTLMGMGMMMLPPTTISMPFKILLFVLADGWNLIIGGVVKSFY